MKYCWQYLEDMCNYREALGYTLEPVKSHIANFSRYLHENYPGSTFLTETMVTPWAQRRPKESQNAFRTRMCGLRFFQRYLYGLQVTDYIYPTDLLPKRTVYIPYIFSDEELLGIFQTVDTFCRELHRRQSPFKYEVLRVLLRLIYYCGLRPSEGRNLRIRDIDLSNAVLVIGENKAHKQRVIPVADDVIEMLKEYVPKVLKQFPTTEYLFPSPSGQPYGKQWLRREFLNAWENSPLYNPGPRVRVYDLRHRWATATLLRLAEENNNIEAVLPYMSAYMGHEHFEDTAYYIHLLPQKLKESTVVDWKKFEDLIPEVPCEDE